MTHTFDSEVSLHSWLLWPTLRRMAAAGGSWERHTKKIAMVALHQNTIAKCVTSSKTVLLWQKTHFLTHLKPIFMRKCVKIRPNWTEFEIILVETIWKAWHTNTIAKCVKSSKTVLLQNTHFLTHLDSISMRKCVKIWQNSYQLKHTGIF